jgi:hypothetical protein
MKRVAAIAAVAAGALGLSAAPAAANHAWADYHWARTSNPFTVKLGNNLSTAWPTSILATASSDWSKSSVTDPTLSSVLRTSIVPGQTTKRCRATAGQDEICNGAYGFNGWLGLASIWVSSSHITQGTVKLNDSYFNTTTYNNDNEKLHVMCQEVGHTFGLDHQSTDGSSLNTCMDYFSNTGANASSTLSTHPNQHDYDELGIIYSHLDSSTTIAASTTTAGARGLRRVRDDLYVEDLGNGNKRFVFVFWKNRGVRHSAPADE